MGQGCRLRRGIPLNSGDSEKKLYSQLRIKLKYNVASKKIHSQNLWGKKMPISITEDIRSITDLKRNTNSVLDQIHKTKRPVILTVNGKAEAVLVDAKEYEKITNAFSLLKLLAPAEEDIKEGRYSDAKDFFQEFKRAKKI